LNGKFGEGLAAKPLTRDRMNVRYLYPWVCPGCGLRVEKRARQITMDIAKRDLKECRQRMMLAVDAGTWTQLADFARAMGGADGPWYWFVDGPFPGP
jgi:hypothetical protein